MFAKLMHLAVIAATVSMVAAQNIPACFARAVVYQGNPSNMAAECQNAAGVEMALKELCGDDYDIALYYFQTTCKQAGVSIAGLNATTGIASKSIAEEATTPTSFISSYPIYRNGSCFTTTAPANGSITATATYTGPSYTGANYTGTATTSIVPYTGAAVKPVMNAFGAAALGALGAALAL